MKQMMMALLLSVAVATVADELHVENVLARQIFDTKEIKLELGVVKIPGGTNSGQLRCSSGTYSLAVDTFWMDRTEVTYSCWKRVYDWAVTHGYSFDNAGDGKGPDHPVHTISAYDALKWCNARSEMEGRKCVYRLSAGVPMRSGTSWDVADLSCDGYRLPTRDEWEYAARGGFQSTLYPWGNTISHAKANYYASPNSSFDDCGSGTPVRTVYDVNVSAGYHPSFSDGFPPYTAPVGSFDPNGYGLYDMVGNVWEFCTSQSGLLIDIPRGGSWANYGYNGIIDHKWNYWYDYCNNGFRCVHR